MINFNEGLHTLTQDDKFKVFIPGKDQPIYLTQREAMIVALMMLGHRAKQIAWKLEISLHTVNSHMANIKHKLECNTNFEVGYRLGWFRFYQDQGILGRGAKVAMK